MAFESTGYCYPLRSGSIWLNEHREVGQIVSGMRNEALSRRLFWGGCEQNKAKLDLLSWSSFGLTKR